jgi:hypothetical protein
VAESDLTETLRTDGQWKRVSNDEASLDLPRHIVLFVWDDDGVFLPLQTATPARTRTVSRRSFADSYGPAIVRALDALSSDTLRS